MSAELLTQYGKEPWLLASAPPEDVVGAAMEFLSSHRNSFDVSLVFDGTMRKVRRQMEDHFSALPGVAEFAVV